MVGYGPKHTWKCRTTTHPCMYWRAGISMVTKVEFHSLFSSTMVGYDISKCLSHMRCKKTFPLLTSIVFQNQIGKMNSKCSICLELLSTKDYEVKSTPCGHLFHSHCLEKAIQTNDNSKITVN